MQGFQKQLTPTCTAQSKIFSKTQEETYPSSIAMKIMQRVWSLPRCQKCIHTPNTLVCFSLVEFEIHGVSSDDQLDQFTKGFCREKFEKARFSVLTCWTLFCGWEGESRKKAKNGYFLYARM